MASTVQDVITKFRRRYPACETSRALELFNETHREFCQRSQLRNAAIDVELVAGQEQYDLDTSVVTVHEAYYRRSSNPSNQLNLIERSLDEYVVMRRGWRMTETNTEPTEYYITSAADDATGKAQVGFWQTPPLTTNPDTGYPKVTLYATTVEDLAEDDTVPSQILNDNVYVYGMWAKWEVERPDGNLRDIAGYMDLAEKEMNKNVNHVKNVQENSFTQIVPQFMLNKSRVK